MKKFPKNKQFMEIWAIEPNFYQLLHHIGLHLEELFHVLVEEQNASMQSLVAKRKRTPQILSLV